MYFRRIGQLERALHHSGRAIELEPANRRYLINRGYVLVADGQNQAAWELIKSMVSTDQPTDRWLADLYARLAPAHGMAEHALAVVRKAAQMPGLPNIPEGRPMMHFAAAQLLDRMGRHDEAFAEAQLGNDLVRSTLPPFDISNTSMWVDRKLAYFTRERIGSLPRANHGNRRPVFIVGLPRSGTSLIEQILACHPAVYAAGELGFLGQIAKQIPTQDWTLGDPYPECFENFTLRQANLLAGRYLSQIEAMNATSRYVTDKLPLNFMNLELVELLFPGARIIHCRRDPRDVGLSCFMTNFSGGNEFKFDLAHIGVFHRDCRRMMEHWKSALNLPIHDVAYESVVNDTETEVRRLLEFLELPWDPRCMRYYENRRRVTTASEDQVRRPIYRSSIGRWKNYEKHLTPLLNALGPDVSA
jgi:hypothetical protein